MRPGRGIPWPDRKSGCVATKTTKHPLEFVDLCDEVLSGRSWNQTKIAGQLDLSVKLVRGAEGNGKESPELLVRAPTRAFGDVGWD